MSSLSHYQLFTSGIPYLRRHLHLSQSLVLVKYFSSHQHTLPVRGYSTPFTLATKTDNFSDSFHLTDTFIGISNLSCTDGADIGFSLGNSVSNLAPFPIENQIYRENSLVTWHFQRRQICRRGYYALSWTLFYVQIRFPANSVWVCMVPSQSCVELIVVNHSDVKTFLTLLNASSFWLSCFGLLKPSQCYKNPNPRTFENC